MPIFSSLKSNTSDDDVAKIQSNAAFLQEAKRLGNALFVDGEGNNIEENGIRDFQRFVNSEENKPRTFEDSASRWFQNKGFDSAIVIDVGAKGSPSYKLHYRHDGNTYAMNLNAVFKRARKN